MTIDRDNLAGFKSLIEDGEFLMPPDHKSSWPQYLNISRPYRDSSSSVGIYQKPTKPAQSALLQIIADIGSVEGLGRREVNLGAYLMGMYWWGELIADQSPWWIEAKERYRIELKASLAQDVHKQALMARDALDDREFAIWCKPRGLNPENYDKDAPKPMNTKTTIMLWAYDLYKSKTKLVIRYAIRDAIDNAVIAENDSPGYLKRLMSEWNVSGGERGIWDFTRLHKDVIDECKNRELIDELT